ncbi:hypothetical protein T03_9434 [Trichinella britovi]|uniref:Uncharacterized protein n=1 Tax=Trichinella britovi TaxID=45882 RepID=A0A0V1AJN2_TRIBR|nr:hypothetical protein T03_9434 [Trichinella britovi]
MCRIFADEFRLNLSTNHISNSFHHSIKRAAFFLLRTCVKLDVHVDVEEASVKREN